MTERERRSTGAIERRREREGESRRSASDAKLRITNPRRERKAEREDHEDFVRDRRGSSERTGRGCRAHARGGRAGREGSERQARKGQVHRLKDGVNGRQGERPP